jgi:hypothetical protein
VKRRPAFATADSEGTRLWKLTREFYDRRGHRLAWIDGTQPRPQMDDLIRALQAASLEGPGRANGRLAHLSLHEVRV